MSIKVFVSGIFVINTRPAACCSSSVLFPFQLGVHWGLTVAVCVGAQLSL